MTLELFRVCKRFVDFSGVVPFDCKCSYVLILCRLDLGAADEDGLFGKFKFIFCVLSFSSMPFTLRVLCSAVLFTTAGRYYRAFDPHSWCPAPLSSVLRSIMFE